MSVFLQEGRTARVLKVLQRHRGEAIALDEIITEADLWLPDTHRNFVRHVTQGTISRLRKLGYTIECSPVRIRPSAGRSTYRLLGEPEPSTLIEESIPRLPDPEFRWAVTISFNSEAEAKQFAEALRRISRRRIWVGKRKRRTQLRSSAPVTVG